MLHLFSTLASHRKQKFHLLEIFNKELFQILRKGPWLVCEINNEVAGYAYAGKHRERKGYQWCTEPSVYISEKYFGFGIANACILRCLIFERFKVYVNAYAVITHAE
jgi:phosphinothricin acetyltransferase